MAGYCFKENLQVMAVTAVAIIVLALIQWKTNYFSILFSNLPIGFMMQSEVPAVRS